MSYAPIAAIIPQYDEQTGFYLKFYQPNTTTPIVMATDSEGTTLLAKCQLDNDGFPTTDGTQLFIPRVIGTYDAYLFPSAALADANDTTNAKRIAKDNRPINSGASASNLRDFGAFGDGVTDDSDAVQDWANQGGILYAPRGVYRITKEIIFPEFVQVYGESAGNGTGGGDPAWATLQLEAALGVTIFYASPDQWDSNSENIFKCFNDNATLNPTPSVSFKDFKIQCPREGAAPANMLNIVNGYDSVYVRNINLMFCHSDYHALALTCTRNEFFPNVGQTGIVENVVAIGDDVYTANGAAVAYIQAQQEMQFIGLKVFGAAESAIPRPIRNCIDLDSCRGITFIGCSSGICSDQSYGLDIYMTDRSCDGIAIVGHTFENCAPLAGEGGTGDTGGSWQIDGLTRRTEPTANMSKIYITSTRYEFPTPVAGAMRNTQQCTVDTGARYVYLTDDNRTSTIYNLLQSRIIDNSGNSTNTTITPVNESTDKCRTYSQSLAIQKDSGTLEFFSKANDKKYRILANIGEGGDSGIFFQKGTADSIEYDYPLVIFAPDGSVQITSPNKGVELRTPDNTKFYELRSENDGTIRMVNPANTADFNINNDIPIVSSQVNIAATSLVIGGTIRRDFTSSNSVLLLEDATAVPINGRFTVTQTNTGTTSITVESGVTLNGILNGSTSLIGYSTGLPVSAYVTKIGSNEYEVTGSINAVT